MAVTTIQIDKRTREALRDFGKKGETYDEVITKLMKLARQVRFYEDIDRIIESEEFVDIDEI
jgi:hypothetical protein